jgi:hypothetical protein
MPSILAKALESQPNRSWARFHSGLILPIRTFLLKIHELGPKRSQLMGKIKFRNWIFKMTARVAGGGFI